MTLGDVHFFDTRDNCRSPVGPDEFILTIVGPLSNLHRKARQLLGLADPALSTSECDPLAPGDPLVTTTDNSQIDQPLEFPSSEAALPPVLPAADSIRKASSQPHKNPPSSPAHPLASADDVHYRPVRRNELHATVRAIMSGNGRLVDEAQVNEFLRQAPSRRIDFGLLWVAERRGRILWSVLPVFSPGHTVLLLFPAIPQHANDRAVCKILIDRVCHALAERKIHLAQSLPDPADTIGRGLLEASGFTVMAELIYLNGQPRRRFATPPMPAGLRWIGYSKQTHELFKTTIAETYELSLDCPELNGVRDMNDVLAGHKASGEFDPTLWRLLCEMGPDGTTILASLGVLLLSRIPQAGALELVYLGLVPKARGRRLGDLLVRQALAGVIESGMDRLTLAVDARNAPALKIYYRNGLSRIGAKVAMMRDLRPPEIKSTPSLA